MSITPSSAFKSQLAKTLAIRSEETGGFVERAAEGDVCGLVLDRTCFYAEGGGQMADRGHMDTDTVALRTVLVNALK